MRALLLGFVLFSACATTGTGHYVNVADVRHDIKDVIDHDTSPRTIVSMGHVTSESAVVYTKAGNGSERREETWVRGADGWQMKETKPLTSAN